MPVDGVSLAELGIANGPARAWSVPRSSVLTQRIDQPNQVTLQLSHPDPASIVSYLQRALPPAGITIVTAQVQGDTSALIGDGHGWRGSVVGAGASLTLLTLQQQAG